MDCSFTGALDRREVASKVEGSKEAVVGNLNQRDESSVVELAKEFVVFALTRDSISVKGAAEVGWMEIS